MVGKPQEPGYWEERQKRNEAHERQLKEERERAPQYISCEAWRNHAIKYGLWLFDPYTKSWYTPDEFYEKFNRLEVSDKLFERVQIKDPVAGIKAANVKLANLRVESANLQSRLEDFTLKVFEYYFKK